MLALFAIIGCQRVEKSVVLVKENFQGNIVIVFNQQEGTPKEYSENRERVYRIPDSGILYSSFDDDASTLISVFFIDEEDKKTPIPIMYQSDELYDSAKIVCYDPRNGAVVRRYKEDQLIAEYPPFLSLLVAEMKKVEEFSKVRDDFALIATQGN